MLTQGSAHPWTCRKFKLLCF